MFAIEILQICKKYGLKVPQDLGIMGYDNIDMLQYISPRICSIEYDVNVLGERLFGELYAQMTQEDYRGQDQILEYRITEGESV